jgi:hypothetical protein
MISAIVWPWGNQPKILGLSAKAQREAGQPPIGVPSSLLLRVPNRRFCPVLAAPTGTPARNHPPGGLYTSTD